MPDADARYAILTWGCQMNEEDSEQMALYLEQMGYQPASNAADADVVLLNTCSVRQKPEEKVYSKLGELRALKADRPEMIVGVCGCMAQVEATSIRRRAPFVDMVVGTAGIASLPDLIREVLGRRAATGGTRLPDGSPVRGRAARARGAVTALDLPPRKGAVVTDIPGRTAERKPGLKAYVPIMYGCDKFCTFCIVPLTRGRERSRPAQEIVREIEGLAASGTREVTLLGQTVNSYGKNLAEGRVPFARLLERIAAVDGIERIRFTSPYPRDFSDDLIETMARLPEVCEHVHLPLQVADDELLARMHRGYTLDGYRRVLSKLRAAMPGIAITTDLMLGFPGEADAQFRNTMAFVEEARFDAAFMFAYSTRPGTKAADMPDQVPQAVKVERLSRLIELQNGITLEMNQSHVGEVYEVLVEGPTPKDATRLVGLTRTFKTVNLPGDPSLVGSLVPARVLEGHLTGFTAEVAQRVG